MSLLKRLRDVRDVAIGRRISADVQLVASIPRLQTQVDTLSKSLKTALDTESFSVRGEGVTGEAKWNRVISDADRGRAAARTPVGHFVTYSVAEDMFDNGFTVDDNRSEMPDPEFNKAVQKALTDLHAKEAFTLAAAFERIYGFSLIAIGFVDGYELNVPRNLGSEVRELYVYAKPQVKVDTFVTDTSSIRFGLPETYTVKRTSQGDTRIHYSRAIHCVTRRPLNDFSLGDWEGSSVLDPAYNDLETLENMRWSLGQTMFRYGPGFPDIELMGASDNQIDEFYASGRFSNINARTYFVHSEREKLEFKGVGGTALDPEKYVNPIMSSLSVATKIPKPILEGAQAGALTGSEVNEREYFKVVSSAQVMWEQFIRVLIDALIASGQVPVDIEDYSINWLGGFELNEKDKATADLTREQANTQRLEYMTVNEVRRLNDLGDVDGGDEVPGLSFKGPQLFNKVEGQDYLVKTIGGKKQF